MRRIVPSLCLALAVCLGSASLADAGEVDHSDPVANVRVNDIDVQLVPMLLVGMEVPVVAVEIENTGGAPSPAFDVDVRVSYYGTTKSRTQRVRIPTLAAGEVRTVTFRQRPEIVGIRDLHGITAIAQPFPGELLRTDNRKFEIEEF